ncbi:hypothetical protein [Sphingosinicella terrae]|uniref:hypothetical protein n=1 Tax=Sphingosinicella terrae TaxID=2172047 RepID=UPI000E0D1846|nr:hypothetical protein [Sphingosinicella terrae]
MTTAILPIAVPAVAPSHPETRHWRDPVRILWAALLLAGMPATARGQAPRVPVPIMAGDPAASLACSTASIMNPDRHNGLVPVRAGPSVRERALARLADGEAVFACIRRGDWFGIVFEAPGERTGCGLGPAPSVSETYSGPCRSGWVRYRHLGGYADWISP